LTKYIFFIAIVFFLIGNEILPQEDNYWNLQYGTRSTLLGGTVIGSVSDLSATYYNPGAIALFTDVKFIISAQAYQYDNYKIKDGAGEGRDLDYSSITPSATFAAFNIKLGFLKTDRVVVSILTRQSNDLEFKTRLIDSIDVVQSSPGKEDFAGGIDYFQNFKDVWAGFTYSTKINDVIGFGCTGYVAVKSYTNQNMIILQALEENGEIASYTKLYNYTYNNWRTLLKAGIGINLNPFTMGVTVTTPSLNILGSGSVGTHLFISGLDSNQFNSNYQDDVKSEYKTSWAAGFGAAYRLDKYKFHFSAEWYDAVNKFYVLETEPFQSQSSGDEISNDLTHLTKSVINYGLGIDYFAADSLIFSASFITDYSAKSSETQLNQPQSLSLNLYHISAGSTFKVWKSLLTLGLVYTFGSQNIGENIDLLQGGNGQIKSNTELKYSQIKVLLGFEL
jgi:hypothetical protein